MRQAWNMRVRLGCVILWIVTGTGWRVWAEGNHDADGAWPAPLPLGRDIPAQRGGDAPEAGITNNPSSYATHDVLTLRQALEWALLYSPVLGAAAHGVRAAEGHARQAGSLPNPEMEYEAEDLGGSDEPAAQQTTIRLSQSIELGGKRSKRRAVARSEARLAGWEYEAQRLDVITQTKKAFVEVLLTQKTLALTEAGLMLAEDVRRVAAERVKAGKVPPLEETRAGVEVSLARIARDKARRDLDTARKLLAATWGGTAPLFAAAGGVLDDIQDIPSLDTLSASLDASPAVARWDTEVRWSRQALALAKAERVPDLALSAGLRRYEDSGVGAGVVGLSLPLPLFDRNTGGMLAAQHQATRADYEQRSARLRATADLTEAHNRLETARAEALTIQTELLPGAQQAFEAAQTGYRAGKFGYLDMLDAQRTLSEAQARYLEALADYQQAAADVERLTGRPLDTLR